MYNVQNHKKGYVLSIDYEKLSMIFEDMSKLKHSMNYEDKLLLLSNMVKKVIEADRCTIWGYDLKQNEFISKIADGVAPLHLNYGDGLVGYSFLTKETIILDDAYDSPFFDKEIDLETGYRTKSIITMPILNAKSEVIGVFQALNKKVDNGIFNDDDRKLLEFVNAYISEVLESTYLYEELRHLNETLEEKVQIRTQELYEAKSLEKKQMKQNQIF